MLSPRPRSCGGVRPRRCTKLSASTGLNGVSPSITLWSVLLLLLGGKQQQVAAQQRTSRDRRYVFEEFTLTLEMAVSFSCSQQMAEVVRNSAEDVLRDFVRTPECDIGAEPLQVLLAGSSCAGPQTIAIGAVGIGGGLMDFERGNPVSPSRVQRCVDTAMQSEALFSKLLISTYYTVTNVMYGHLTAPPSPHPTPAPSFFPTSLQPTSLAPTTAEPTMGPTEGPTKPVVVFKPTSETDDEKADEKPTQGPTQLANAQLTDGGGSTTGTSSVASNSPGGSAAGASEGEGGTDGAIDFVESDALDSNTSTPTDSGTPLAFIGGISAGGALLMALAALLAKQRKINKLQSMTAAAELHLRQPDDGDLFDVEEAQSSVASAAPMPVLPVTPSRKKPKSLASSDGNAPELDTRTAVSSGSRSGGSLSGMGGGGRSHIPLHPNTSALERILQVSASAARAMLLGPTKDPEDWDTNRTVGASFDSNSTGELPELTPHAPVRVSSDLSHLRTPSAMTRSVSLPSRSVSRIEPVVDSSTKPVSKNGQGISSTFDSVLTHIEKYHLPVGDSDSVSTPNTVPSTSGSTTELLPAQHKSSQQDEMSPPKHISSRPRNKLPPSYNVDNDVPLKQRCGPRVPQIASAALFPMARYCANRADRDDDGRSDRHKNLDDQASQKSETSSDAGRMSDFAPDFNWDPDDAEEDDPDVIFVEKKDQPSHQISQPFRASSLSSSSTNSSRPFGSKTAGESDKKVLLDSFRKQKFQSSALPIPPEISDAGQKRRSRSTTPRGLLGSIEL